MAATDDAIIEKAIDYIRTILSAAVEGIQGCTDDEISGFELSRGVEFSAIHRAFLRRFGDSAGGMDFGPTDPTLRALREMYEETAGELPHGYELLAVSREDPYLDVFLIHSGAAEPAVGTCYSLFGSDFGQLDLKEMQVVCGTLTELLCYMPYVKARYTPKPLQFMLTNKNPVAGAMERFDRVIRDNGLATLWFSSSLSRIVEFGDTVLLAKQIAGTPLAVSVGSSNKVEFAAAHWWLTHDVGLEAGV